MRNNEFWKKVGGIESVSRGIGDVQRGIGDVKKLFEPAPMKVKPYNPPKPFNEIATKRGLFSKILLILKTILLCAKILCFKVLLQPAIGGLILGFLFAIIGVLNFRGQTTESDFVLTVSGVFLIFLILNVLYSKLAERSKSKEG